MENTLNDLKVKRERYYYYIACAVEYLKYAITDIVEFGSILESLNRYYAVFKEIDAELLELEKKT